MLLAKNLRQSYLTFSQVPKVTQLLGLRKPSGFSKVTELNRVA